MINMRRALLLVSVFLIITVASVSTVSAAEDKQAVESQNVQEDFLESFSVSEKEVEVGDTVEVRAVFKNQFNFESPNGEVVLFSQVLSYGSSPGFTGSSDMTMYPGQRVEVTRTVKVKEAGQQTMEVRWGVGTPQTDKKEILGDLEEREIEIEVEGKGLGLDLRMDERTIPEGESNTAEIRVTNHEDETKSYNSVIKVDGDKVANVKGKVKPNSRQVTEKGITIEEPGRHSVQVSLENRPVNSQEASVIVKDVPEQNVAVKDIVKGPSKLRVGEVVGLTTVLENTGEKDARNVEGVILTERTTESFDTRVNAGDKQYIPTKHKFKESGKHEVRVLACTKTSENGKCLNTIRHKEVVEVFPQKVPPVALEKFAVTPLESNSIVAGESVEIEAVVENNHKYDFVIRDGKIKKDTRVIENIDGKVEARQTRTMTFKTEFSQSGEHTLSLNLNSGAIEEDIKLNVEEPEENLEKLEVGDIQSDELVRVGERSEVVFKVRNPNDQTRQLEGKLTMDYNVKVPLNVEVRGGQTKTVKRKFVPTIVGNHRMKLKSEDVKEGVSTRINVQPGKK